MENSGGERGLEYGAISTNYSTFASAASGKTGSVHRGEGGLLGEGPKVFRLECTGNSRKRYEQVLSDLPLRDLHGVAAFFDRRKVLHPDPGDGLTRFPPSILRSVDSPNLRPVVGT